eukprot:9085812-Pyramimonas_sp.AAC.1
MVKVAGPCGLCRGPGAFAQEPPRARARIIRGLRKQERTKLQSWLGKLPAEWRAIVEAAISRPQGG